MAFKDTFNRFFCYDIVVLRCEYWRSDANFERESLDVFAVGYSLNFDSGAGWLSNNSR